jgi:phosphoglycolate phosphatase
MTSGALLLDLDGTLVDTAPDMVACLNRLLIELGHPEVEYSRARGQVSNGAIGLLALGLNLPPEHARVQSLRQRYLDMYATCLAEESIIFNDFCSVFHVLSHAGWHWGVVTNKPQALAAPLLRALGLAPTADCLVGGDTLPHRKPHPAPLLHAADLLGLPATRCIYVGDAERDVQAGRAAGMRTVVARYGYLAEPAEADRWQADHVVDSPLELAALLERLRLELARAG